MKTRKKRGWTVYPILGPAEHTPGLYLRLPGPRPRKCVGACCPQAHLAIGLIRIVDCNLTDEDTRAGNKIHQPQL